MLSWFKNRFRSTTIVAVVDAAGLTTSGFDAIAWRDADGVIHQTPMRLRADDVPDYLFSRWLGIAKSETVVLVKARPFSSGEDIQEAALLDIECTAEDPDLEKILDHYQKPITFADGQFGTFTLDRLVKWYSAKLLWNRKPIELVICCGEEQLARKLVDDARIFWEDSESWNERFENCASENLLDLANDWARQADESENGSSENRSEEISSTDFISRLKMLSLDVYEDGRFSVAYNDGDLFWGHQITVWGTIKDGPTGATI